MTKSFSPKKPENIFVCVVMLGLVFSFKWSELSGFFDWFLTIVLFGSGLLFLFAGSVAHCLNNIFNLHHPSDCACQKNKNKIDKKIS